MDTLFLDANVLFSAAYTKEARLRTLWTLKTAKLITSIYAVDEAHRNLRTTQQQADLEKLLQAIEVALVAPADRPLKSVSDLPAKDRPILLAAIDHRATHLLTGDWTHFGRYYGKTIEGVLILPPALYLRGHF